MSTTETLALVVGPGEFIQLRPELVRALGGEPDAAMVLTLIKWKIDPQYRHVYQHEGYDWWLATMEDLCDRTGMTLSRVRRALKALIGQRVIIGQQHHLKGPYDHAMSYRLAVESDDDSSSNAPETLENTDMSSATDRDVTDDRSTSHPQQIDVSPAANLLPVKTLRNSLNTDSVGEEDSSQRWDEFDETQKRVKLMTDAMVASGQSYAVPQYLAWLWTQDYRTGSDLIRRWCGIQVAARNGKMRRDVDELLIQAGITPLSAEAWAEFLAATPPASGDHGDGCRYDEASGYCLEHGLRRAG